MNGLVARIAYRNLREHTTKTLIIGSLVALGMMVFVIGNSFMDTIRAGVKENYIDNYTGHLFIAPATVESPSLTMSEEMMEAAAPVLPAYQDLKEYVTSRSGVQAATGQINGVARIQWGELGEGFAMLRGVAPVPYENMFPDGVEIVKGSFLNPEEEGIVLSQSVADMLTESAGQEIKPGDSVLLTGMNAVSGMKVREVTVRGIHDYGDAAFDISLVSFLDANNMRILNGMTRGVTAMAGSSGGADQRGDAEATDTSGASGDDFGGGAGEAGEGTDFEDDLFGQSVAGQSGTGQSEDDLFGGDSLFGGASSVPGDASSGGAGQQEGRGPDAASSVPVDGSAPDEGRWLNILGDLSERDRLSQTDPNAWSYLLIRLEDDRAIASTVRDLNAYFEENGMAVRAWEWIDGAGMSAALVDTLQTAFNIILIIVAVVAIIIIMNTLVISVTERFGEIGTMRAIGAKKPFVRRMIVQETLMIAGVFGLVGILAGWIVLKVIGAFGLEASNQFMQILLGSGVFRPDVSASAVLSALVVTALVGATAALYPTSVALRISPLAAMNRN